MDKGECGDGRLHFNFLSTLNSVAHVSAKSAHLPSIFRLDIYWSSEFWPRALDDVSTISFRDRLEYRGQRAYVADTDLIGHAIRHGHCCPSQVVVR